MKAISGKRMCAILARRGWVLSRISGGHHVFWHPDRPGVNLAVPVHGNRDLATGTQKGIMRTAGLAEADL